jgi:hypothetical protein
LKREVGAMEERGRGNGRERWGQWKREVGERGRGNGREGRRER